MTIRELREELEKIEEQDSEIVSIGVYSGWRREYEYVLRTKNNSYDIGKLRKD
jgi:hypothetical protein